MHDSLPSEAPDADALLPADPFTGVAGSVPSDADLVARCRAGEAAAWSLLVRRYQRLVFTVPRRAGLDSDDAADVFQHTLTRLYEHLDRLEDPARVRAWLVTTARHETLRFLRSQARTPRMAEVFETEEDDETDPVERMPDPARPHDEVLAELQDLARVRAAIDLLDPRSRQLIELLFLQDEPLPYDEIARRMNMPEGSIGPTRARCLAKIRQCLTKL